MKKRTKFDTKFEDVVEEHYAELFRFGIALGGGPADAIDLTHQTFRRYETRGNPLYGAKKTKVWLFAELYREFRKRYGRREGGVGIGRGSAYAVSGLQGVDEQYIAPLTMFYAGGFSAAEISEALALPIDAVRSRLQRGRAQLKSNVDFSHQQTLAVA